MKTRIIILIAISAILTLSFTIASVNTKKSASSAVATEKTIKSEPVGGLLSQEKL